MIDYKKVIDLGFRREDQSDSIFYDEYGFNWFIVTLRLFTAKNKDFVELDWDCNTREVEMIRYDKECTILSRMKIETYDELVRIVNFFKS